MKATIKDIAISLLAILLIIVSAGLFWQIRENQRLTDAKIQEAQQHQEANDSLLKLQAKYIQTDQNLEEALKSRAELVQVFDSLIYELIHAKANEDPVIYFPDDNDEAYQGYFTDRYKSHADE